MSYASQFVGVSLFPNVLNTQTLITDSIIIANIDMKELQT
jgi:hypothetical protein